MSIDKSLKRGSRLARSRNVLRRDERIAQMKTDDKWMEGMGPFGLPKTRVQKLATGKKKKKKEEGEEGAAPAAAGGKAAAGKAAAPAKGAGGKK